LKNKRGFASDNYAGVHPSLLARMADVNNGHEVAYGEDSETEVFAGVVKELFGNDAVGFQSSTAPVQML